jgi:DNA polymerase V
MLAALFSDNLSAGFPSAAEGYEDEPLDLHRYLVRNPAATFFYRVRGNALAASAIRDGALLVVDRSVRPATGQLAVMESEGEFVVDRFWPPCPAVVCGAVVAVVMRM